ERSAGGDGTDRRAVRAWRLCGSTEAPPLAAAAHPGELRRIQSDSREGGDGGDGTARRVLSSPARAAERGRTREGAARAAEPEDAWSGGPRLDVAPGNHNQAVRAGKQRAQGCRARCLPAPARRAVARQGPIG